jgi:hypothetical protein
MLLAGALLALLGPMARARAATCEDAAGLAILPSPLTPWKGVPLRVLLVAEKPIEGELSLVAPDGSVTAISKNRGGGPPYFWYAEVKAPIAGKWRATLNSAQCDAVTRDIAVRAERPPGLQEAPQSVWPIRNSWNRVTENLFSAWIEKLFTDPPDATPSWPALHAVLRDPARNFLFNHLGLNEDQAGVILRPDCADLPYFLRAYFAFKMGLPFGYTICSRGGGGKGPKCFKWFGIQNDEAARAVVPEDGSADDERPLQPAAPSAKRHGLAAAFARYLPSLANGVHSGSARTVLADNNTDYYPVQLTQDTLRPGTIYADPYGHVLMIVQRVPESNGEAGVMFAVDGQPDGTVARKRYWRGNFLFTQDPALGGPGFKRFRPIVRDKSGVLRRLTNAEIAKDPQYGDFALDQAKFGVEDFYDRMDDVLSPEPLDPRHAMEDALASLDEQVKVRVTSVENGRKFQNSGRGDVQMPDGPAIFETTGAWEDFSTPARDLRLLIALDVVRGFPDRVARRPERYAMPQGKSAAGVKAELQSMLASELPTLKFSYTRSDGSSWTLSLNDVMDRMAELEMAYNPNDCVELRWGASANSEEASTCRRHAPPAQRATMTGYRAWFHERRRPPRAQARTSATAEGRHPP